jgi:hypothetical protein
MLSTRSRVEEPTMTVDQSARAQNLDHAGAGIRYRYLLWSRILQTDISIYLQYRQSFIRLLY